MTSDFIGRGWPFPLVLGEHGGVALVDGTANLEKAMLVVLRTRLGERPMRPAFGSRLHEYLFQSLAPDTLTAIADEVRRALHSCEPRVRVDAVEVSPRHAHRGRVDIRIDYTVAATNDEHNLVVPFYTIPGEEE